jgi:predicted phosphodiesterase
VRVAVLADIHGNLPALEAVLREVDAAGAEAVVLAGDMTVGPLQAETLDLLDSLVEENILHGPPSDTEALELLRLG